MSAKLVGSKPALDLLDLRFDHTVREVLAERLAANFREALHRERREAEGEEDSQGSWRWADTHSALLAACDLGVDLESLPNEEGGTSRVRECVRISAGGVGGGRTSGCIPFKPVPHLSCDCDYGADGGLQRINVRLERSTYRVDVRRLDVLAASGGASGRAPISQVGDHARAQARVRRARW